MPGSSPIVRWGSLLSVLIAVALAFTLQRQKPLSCPSKTYCYKGIRTHNDAQPSASCFSVADGVFTQVSSEEASNVQDGYVIPGLWDGHGHLLDYGEFLNSVDLFGAQSLDEVRSRLKKYIAANPGVGTRDNWIWGLGWDQAAFGRMPTAADIEQDSGLKGVYMMLSRVDVHCDWVSQAVIDLLPSPVPDVPGGEVIRDPGLGVFCDNARNQVNEHAPKSTPETKMRNLKSAMRKLNELGLVGMHDAGVVPQDLKLYEQMADSDDWSVRVYAMMACDQRNTFCAEDAKKKVRDDGLLSVRSVKLFADGALGSWGSAMIEPYTDNPSSSGSLLINSSGLTSVAKTWAAAGFQVNIHAIGDLANRNTIGALEAALLQECPDSSSPAALKQCQETSHRFRIEHAQIIHPDDQVRMHALGLIPSIQPTHATSDMAYAESRLGPHRTATEAYKMRSLLDIRPILGSDFPVEPPNPFEGVYAAVTRKNPHTGLGRHGEKKGWLTEETLSMEQALWGFTGAPAHGAFLDGKAGQIREGAFADWVVLDEPLEGMNVEKLRDLKVRETWVAGRKVYSR